MRRKPSSLEPARGPGVPVKAIRRMTTRRRDDGALRIAAGVFGFEVGEAAGLGLFGEHQAEGAVAPVALTTRLLNPFDTLAHPFGPSPAQEMLQAAAGALHRGTALGGTVMRHAAHDISHPKALWPDVSRQIHRLRTRTDPSATPMGKTPAEEFRRTFKIGATDGEIGANVATSVLGGPMGETAEALTAARRATPESAFLAMGYDAKNAHSLAQPYTGVGHHWIPVRTLKKLGIPEWIGNSPWNVLKPHGINKGDFYVTHYTVDSKMHGAPLPGKGRGWSGKKHGAHKLDSVGRVIVGAPTRLKGTVMGQVAVASGAIAKARDQRGKHQ